MISSTRNSIITLFCVSVFVFSACGQTGKLTTKNKKAIQVYTDGVEYLDQRKYPEAEEKFLNAIELDNVFVEAHQMLAFLYEEIKKYDEAIEYYEKVIQIDPKFFPNNYFTLGNLQLASGQYEKAKANFIIFSGLKDVSVALQMQSEENVIKADFAIQLMQNPVSFQPINLGENINTEFGDYSPTLTADEQVLYYTVRRKRDEYTQCARCPDEEDFYISRRNEGKWTKAVPLGHPINSHDNEGAACISPDGKIFYYTACNRDDGLGSCDIYFSKKEGSKWSSPINCGSPLNSTKWDSQPSIAPDGKTLYFASARGGNKDIFVSIQNEDGQWSVPQSLGSVINTNKDEMSPFIHPDGKTLYFTSEGHLGMGGMDIFYSKKQDDGSWSIPQNIGYPINTHHDEGFFIVSASGATAYYSSDQLGGSGKFDLYSFDLPLELRPEPVNYIKGVITDAIKLNYIFAEFELINLTTGETVVKSFSDPIDGTFLVCLPSNASYALHVSKTGYLFYSQHFELNDTMSQTDPIMKNIELQPIRTGEIVVMRNIFFDFDSDVLKPESKVELNKLIVLLVENPSLCIEIRGHTDNIGSADYNKMLSEKRALSVLNYLTEKGVDRRRLAYKGYGATVPVDTNETEEGRAKNRRTEFKVTHF